LTFEACGAFINIFYLLILIILIDIEDYDNLSEINDIILWTIVVATIFQFGVTFIRYFLLYKYNILSNKIHTYDNIL